MKFTLVLFTILVGSFATPAHAFQEDPRPLISPRPILYGPLLRQIERIRKALQRIELAPKGVPSSLIASAPEYPDARDALEKETLAVLHQYVGGLEEILARAKRLSDENAALAQMHQSEVNALMDAAQEARGDERSALLQSARQIRNDAEHIINENTRVGMIQLGQLYSATVVSALNYQDIVSVSTARTHRPRAKIAFFRGLFTTLNIGAHVFWATQVPAADRAWVAIAVPAEAELANLIEGGDWEVFLSALPVGLLHIPLVAIERKIMNKTDTDQQILSREAAELFTRCSTATCVYRLKADYLRFFKILSGLDGALDLGDSSLESPLNLRYRTVKRFMNRVAELAAKPLPAAVFTPAPGRR